MRYWYDLEFLEDGKTVDLISIGIVAEDGREYYAVNSQMPVSRIKRHDWLMENVWPHLPTYGGATARAKLDIDHPDVKMRSQIAGEVRNFLTVGLKERQRAELWAYFGAYDHVALAQLWGPMSGIPEGLPMFTHELMQLWEDAGCPKKPEKPYNAHNALADARWNRDLWRACLSAANWLR